jgi:hypothetical protein
MHEIAQTRISHPMNALSLPGVLTLLVAAGIIFIGIREFFYPAVGAQGFGVPLWDPHDGPLLAIKAARDVTTGILTLTFLALRDRKILAIALAVLTLIPILDGLVVFSHADWTFTPVLLIHWGTAAFMLVIVALLKREK